MYRGFRPCAPSSVIQVSRVTSGRISAARCVTWRSCVRAASLADGMSDEDVAPAARHLRQQLRQGRPGRRVEPVEGVVEHDEVGPRREPERAAPCGSRPWTRP